MTVSKPIDWNDDESVVRAALPNASEEFAELRENIDGGNAVIWRNLRSFHSGVAALDYVHSVVLKRGPHSGSELSELLAISEVRRQQVERLATELEDACNLLQEFYPKRVDRRYRAVLSEIRNALDSEVKG